jgi:hypothetical protein
MTVTYGTPRGAEVSLEECRYGICKTRNSGLFSHWATSAVMLMACTWSLKTWPDS